MRMTVRSQSWRESCIYFSVVMCSGAVSVNGDLKHIVRCPFVLVDTGLPQKSSHKEAFLLKITSVSYLTVFVVL